MDLGVGRCDHCTETGVAAQVVQSLRPDIAIQQITAQRSRVRHIQGDAFLVDGEMGEPLCVVLDAGGGVVVPLPAPIADAADDSDDAGGWLGACRQQEKNAKPCTQRRQWNQS